MRTAFFGFLASLALSSLAGCGVESRSSDPNIDDPTMTGSDAVTSCSKKVYVHVIAYGYTQYSDMFADKNSCWGLEAPKWTGGATWGVCNTKGIASGGTRWAYDDVNIGSAGHADVSSILGCKAKNGGKADIAYVAANSGSAWSHAGITGVERFFNECYDTDFAVKNRLGGCASSGSPMWNIGASTNVYADVLALCKSRGNGDWLGIYASTVGLHGKEAEIVKALNYCTTH